jgi:hypothetical protein
MRKYSTSGKNIGKYSLFTSSKRVIGEKMTDRHSKTKNLEVYTYLLNYNTQEEAYKNAGLVASHLKIQKNRVISCVYQAGKNPLISKALVDDGYDKNQIQPWFAKPFQEDLEERNSESRENTATQDQTITAASNRVSEDKRPRYIMDVQVIDWRESQNIVPAYQPKTWYERAFEKDLRERQEHHERERKARKLADLNRRLSGAQDPFTYIQIALENPDWRDNWYSLSPFERKQYFDLIFQMILNKNYIIIAENNQKWFNEVFFPFWFTGRWLGKW